jgi:pyruvate dehydrogenase E1 component alpha subunit
MTADGTQYKLKKGGLEMSLVVVDNVTDFSGYDKGELLDLFKTMTRIRQFDVNLVRLITEGKVAGFYHSGQGHEAIATGTCSAVNADDYVYYHHRGCNVMVAKGMPLVSLYGDFLMREIGSTGGLGAGIVHSCWPELGILGQSGTIGEAFILAAGTAYSSKYFKSGQVTLCYNGDGTHAREVFHGGMNFAALHKLPVVFICENNGYGISAPLKEDHAIDKYLAERAGGYGIPAYVVDGTDVLAVKAVTEKAVARARAGEGPTFIECIVRRLRGHYEGDPVSYVDSATMASWHEKEDPMKNYRANLLAAGKATEAELSEIEAAVLEEVLEAIKEADASPLPPRERIFEGLFSKEVI